MSESPTHRTTPDHHETGLPKGVPFIIGNEAAERFSFYGMRAILTVFMTKYLVDSMGNDATYGDEKAKEVYHLFVAVAYFTPMIGALISDIFLGKYRTILLISMMYCLGHGALAMMDLGPHLGKGGSGGWDMEPFLFSGLFLIALGAGGIKPCVSAHVGDQFGHGNKRLLTQVFNWFYFSINVGAAASQILTPWLLDAYGPWLAFGLPGVLMAIATFVFWLGRSRFIHVPPAGWQKFKRETFSPDGVRALMNLSPIFLLFVPMFWAIFDQTGSAWVIQADQMNRELGILWLPSQIQFVNPVMILLGIPLFTYGVYPLMGKFFKVTPLRKIGIGLALTSASFGVSALVEMPIQEKQAGIATTLYAELGESIPTIEFPDIERRAKLVKAAIAAVDTSAWDPARRSDVLELDHASVAAAITENNLRGFFGGADAESLLKELGVPVPQEGATSAAATGQIFDAAAEAGWSPEQYAENGIGLLRLTNALDDESLLALMPTDRTAGVFLALGLGMTEDAGPSSDLAAAVKASRAAWVIEPVVPGGKVRPDEERVSAYLTEMPNIAWQFLAYLILTSAEIMVSIVCLEFAYTQSPPKMKSFVMGVYFLGVSLGNFFVSLVNKLIGSIEASTGVNPLEGANYYWFFGGLMLLTAIVYVFWSKTYKGQTYIQGDDEGVVHSEAVAEGADTR